MCRRAVSLIPYFCCHCGSCCRCRCCRSCSRQTESPSVWLCPVGMAQEPYPVWSGQPPTARALDGGARLGLEHSWHQVSRTVHGHASCTLEYSTALKATVGRVDPGMALVCVLQTRSAPTHAAPTFWFLALTCRCYGARSDSAPGAQLIPMLDLLNHQNRGSLSGMLVTGVDGQVEGYMKAATMSYKKASDLPTRVLFASCELRSTHEAELATALSFSTLCPSPSPQSHMMFVGPISM